VRYWLVTSAKILPQPAVGMEKDLKGFWGLEGFKHRRAEIDVQLPQFAAPSLAVAKGVSMSSGWLGFTGLGTPYRSLSDRTQSKSDSALQKNRAIGALLRSRPVPGGILNSRVLRQKIAQRFNRQLGRFPRPPFPLLQPRNRNLQPVGLHHFHRPALRQTIAVPPADQIFYHRGEAFLHEATG
jgi:hypothetical protein